MLSKESLHMRSLCDQTCVAIFQTCVSSSQDPLNRLLMFSLIIQNVILLGDKKIPHRIQALSGRFIS